MKGRGKGKEKPEGSWKEKWTAECACGEEWEEEKLRGKNNSSIIGAAFFILVFFFFFKWHTDRRLIQVSC